MQIKKPIPKTDGIDHTLTLIKQGFHFLPQTRKKLNSDLFETRLMGKKAVCMAGREAAEMFYDNTIFKRKGAAPLPLKQTLLGQGGVHGLDGEQHKQRKRMHLSLITPERLEAMKNIALQELDAKAKQWENQKQVVLFDELNEILTRTGLKWAGVPLEEKDVKKRTEELTHMVDSFGGSVSRYRNGKRARDSHEKWLKEIIKKIRAGKYQPPAYTSAYIISNHREPNGKLLDVQTAAVELNNTYRPLLATAYWIIFGALALHQYPDTYFKMKKDEDDYSHMFAQEVRRFYPFAPAMAAKVKKSFYWQDYHFKKELLVVLDLYGTNMHEDDWQSPNEFKPERFINWKGSPFSFVPQGGGDHHIGHRCAGEWLTVMVMRSFYKYFVDHLSYDVPDQDFNYDLNRIPTLPNSHFIMKNVKRTKDSLDDLILDIQTRPVI
ncbi:cytochrome P450 [Alkalibacillus haloalkaliphilus]|uniref:cytochrome P450 n=1 Tax=Alkalibacillus haloalkaliphilus TaxID=94136 RepID=UPI00293680E3|nr:cytochrome P450 [Alkalibacillus haloalkaliphilus]MDV2582444.1 cytochrome P450 [Alkalibacillus haloalkaliphilus]